MIAAIIIAILVVVLLGLILKVVGIVIGLAIAVGLVGLMLVARSVGHRIVAADPAWTWTLPTTGVDA